MLEIVVELTPRCSSYMMHVSAGKSCGVGLRGEGGSYDDVRRFSQKGPTVLGP